MPNLFPINYRNQTITAEEVEASDRIIGYKKSLAYDFEQCAVIRDGQNKIPDATGIEAWKQWCYNCLSTERYSCAAYSSDFGIQTEKIRTAETRDEAEAILAFEINEALMADPYKRTKSIDCTFNWINPDSVEIILTLTGIDDALIDVLVPINI